MTLFKCDWNKKHDGAFALAEEVGCSTSLKKKLNAVYVLILSQWSIELNPIQKHNPRFHFDYVFLVLLFGLVC